MNRRDNRILAIAPVHRGFGLVVVDAAGRLIDWRVKEIREEAEHRNARCHVELDKLIDEHRPAVLVIEDHRAPGSKKHERIKDLLDLLTEHAVDSGIGVEKFGPRAMRLALGLQPSVNKLTLANEVAKHMLALKARTPKEKQIWQQEPYSMPIFVAAALALAHLGRAQRREVGR